MQRIAARPPGSSTIGVLTIGEAEFRHALFELGLVADRFVHCGREYIARRQYAFERELPEFVDLGGES